MAHGYFTEKNSTGKNLFFVPFYYDEEKRSGVNIEKKENRLDTYLSNCCVALLSARENNPDIDVALVTNLGILKQPYLGALQTAGIEIIYCPYDAFLFPDDFKWSAAFYKLCALKHIANKYLGIYENLLYTDSDVFCQSSFAPIWEECVADKILLFDLCESSSNTLYKQFCCEIHEIDKTLRFPVHYGGEFFASNTKNSIEFVKKCASIYDLLINKHIVFSSGDELILSAAGNLCTKVKNAGAFVYRFWTDSFRITTTRCLFNPVSILHCPDQKERGLTRLFVYYLRHKAFPSKRIIHSILKLNRTSAKTKIIKCLSVFIKKYRIKSYYE